MLPLAPEESGYYVYGTPDKGAFQYAHPSMMTVLLWVEREWAAIDTRKFGVGNISKAGGIENEHASHSTIRGHIRGYGCGLITTTTFTWSFDEETAIHGEHLYPDDRPCE
jgi:hypothetical protein